MKAAVSSRTFISNKPASVAVGFGVGACIGTAATVGQVVGTRDELGLGVNMLKLSNGGMVVGLGLPTTGLACALEAARLGEAGHGQEACGSRWL